MSKLDYILAETSSQISFFTKKRNENRTRVLGFGVASASLSAIATVAIGATKFLSLEWLPLVALVATAIATVIAIWETVFAYRRLWAINNTALAALYKLKRTIDYTLAENGKQIPEAQMDQFFQELDTIITEADAEWVKTYAVK
jgi:hypothetical protein